MPINETIVAGTPSASSVMTEVISDVVVTEYQGGGLILECQAPSQSVWAAISGNSGAYPVSTSDPNVLYRFRLTRGTAKVYMGP